MNWQLDWTPIFRWIESVPNVIWSGVIASIITLIGVLVSNRGNTKRLHQQHQHEAQQKTKERITNIRRDLYMTAASEMSNAMAHLGTIPNLDPRTDNLTAPLIALNTTGGKCQLVAEKDTSKIMADVLQRINQVTLSLIVKAQPMFNEKLEAEYHQLLRDSAKERFDAILADQKRLLEQESFNEPRFALLTEQSAKATEEFQHHGKQMLDALDRRLALQKQYTLEMLRESEQIVQAQIPLIVALRAELELSTDVNELRQRMTSGLKAMQDTLNHTIAEIS
ncbi:MAG: hypothetical protein JSS23_11755 [Proteobacteria bacterium]|nr:hypothetical protein [Pseudomonadota bacterium]